VPCDASATVDFKGIIIKLLRGKLEKSNSEKEELAAKLKECKEQK